VSSDQPPVDLAAPPDDAAGSVGEAPLKEDAKRLKREAKLMYDATRPLDGWERYRALVDASDEAYELIDIANREARFALIVMGALNAVPLVVASRADVASVLTPNERVWIIGLLLGYGLLVLTFILQAIDALRPGRFRPHVSGWQEGAIDMPAGVRYYEDVIQRSAADHWTAWQDLRLSQLNAELAMQVHSLALKNNAKHVALRRLYVGLRAMALSLTALILLFVFFAWT
jgi:hypothetical protein